MKRYIRNISVEAIGKEGQQNLLNSCIAIIGCGALGNIAAAYLVAAGVGKIKLIDFDTIDISNLQRQVFFTEEEAGESKAACLANRLKKLNSEIQIEPIKKLFNNKNSADLLYDVDFVIDATDNPASKILIDKECERIGIPCCIGGVKEFSGQLMTSLPGGTRYYDIFSEAAETGFTPCSISGVIGPAAGVLASLQAAEAIKYLTKSGQSLNGYLLTFNLQDNSFQKFKL